MSDTIAAIATGASVSAIGIVRISGDKAIELADSLFTPFSGKSMAAAEPHRLYHGTLRCSGGEPLDVCLCTVSRAPNSYTGEDTAELQCHGSPTVLRALLDELFMLGARQALPGEFTKRAFLNGRMDLISAEAVADIIDAETADSAKNAAGQLGGAISGRLDGIYSLLTDISSHYHAVLDYPDEDIDDFVMESYRESLLAAAEELEGLHKSYDSGKLLKSGVPAAIIGRPNAGKSSLLNAICGFDRAIVTNIPGTTRDTIEEKLKLGGVLLRLTDTAGLRETEDEIERLGVERSRRAVSAAELVIAVLDGSLELSDDEREIITIAESAPKGIVVISKSDISQSSDAPETSLPVVSLSSVTGEGLNALGEAVRQLFPLPSAPSGEIITNARQADAVYRALQYIRSAISALSLGQTPDIVLTECEGAMQAIGELSGKTVREDVTNRIFQRFCVGK